MALISAKTVIRMHIDKYSWYEAFPQRQERVSNKPNRREEFLFFVEVFPKAVRLVMEAIPPLQEASLVLWAASTGINLSHFDPYAKCVLQLASCGSQPKDCR